MPFLKIRELVENIRKAILARNWLMEGHFMLVRAFAWEWDVSPETAHLALRELRDQKLQMQYDRSGAAYVVPGAKVPPRSCSRGKPRFFTEIA